MAFAAAWCLSLVSGPGAAQDVELPAEQHPSLLFAADDIPVLQERIQREPYASWWQIVQTRAESAPATFDVERSKARFAKSLAFAYLMTEDQTLAERAVALMLDMKFPPRGGDLGEPHNEGEVVALYAQAYDMLHTFLDGDPASQTEIRTILAEEAARLHKGIVIQEIKIPFLPSIKIRLHETTDPRDLSVTHLDNWHIRVYGALGLAAFALGDHPGSDGRTPQEWADRAFDLVTRSLVHQVDEVDGGYAEGPFYSRYAADVYLPYLFALKRLSGTDLFVDQAVQSMHDWSVNIRLPNGLRPNIEDGHLSSFYGNYLAAVDVDGGVHRWDWENNANGLYVREFSELDAIALYDDSVTAQEPTHGPSVFMPGAGDAVFRSSWGSEATYMLLRGEHGRARRQGLGHEHADETSFIIYAAEEMLALDAGYINFANHDKVNQGRSHNVILVDGEGPPITYLLGEAVDGGNDAFIEETFFSEFMDYAEVRAFYENADVRRRVMFPDKAYFIVGDEVRADVSHAYEWRLHGHGGGSSGGTYQREGGLARWTRANAELLAYLPEREGRTFAESDTLHSFDFMQEPTHTMLQVREEAADTEFLSVLFPRALNPPGEEPAFAALTTTGGQAVQIALTGRDDFAWIARGDADTVRVQTSYGEIISDGAFGLARIENGSVTAVSIQDGSFLSIDTTHVFSADAEVDLSLTFGDGAVEGFIGGSGAYQIALHTADSVSAATFQEVPATLAFTDGIATIDLAGEGSLVANTAGVSAPVLPGLGEMTDPEVTDPEATDPVVTDPDVADPDVTDPVATDPEVQVPTTDYDNNGKVDLLDFFIFADAYGQPVTEDTARFDLDDNGKVDLLDFFIFADTYGQ